MLCFFLPADISTKIRIFIAQLAQLPIPDRLPVFVKDMDANMFILRKTDRRLLLRLMNPLQRHNKPGL